MILMMIGPPRLVRLSLSAFESATVVRKCPGVVFGNKALVQHSFNNKEWC